MVRPLKIEINLESIRKTIGAFSGFLFAVFVLAYSYLTSLATKAQLNELRVELRIKDIESSLYIYNQQDLDKLDNYSKQRYKRLQGLLTAYESQLLKVQGISTKVPGISDD